MASSDRFQEQSPGCGLKRDPELHAIQDPARLDWKLIVKVEHYRLSQRQIIADYPKGRFDATQNPN